MTSSDHHGARARIRGVPGTVRVEVDGAPLLRRAGGRGRRAGARAPAPRSTPGCMTRLDAGRRCRGGLSHARSGRSSGGAFARARPGAPAGRARGIRPRRSSAALARRDGAGPARRRGLRLGLRASRGSARGRGPARVRRDLAAHGGRPRGDRPAPWRRSGRPTWTMAQRALELARHARGAARRAPARRPSGAGCSPSWPGAGTPATSRTEAVSQLV